MPIALGGDILIAAGTEIDQPSYDVLNFYKTTGFAQAVARNSFFGQKNGKIRKII